MQTMCHLSIKFAQPIAPADALKLAAELKRYATHAMSWDIIVDNLLRYTTFGQLSCCCFIQKLRTSNPLQVVILEKELCTHHC